MEIYTYTDFIQPIGELASKLDVLNVTWHNILRKWEYKKKKQVTPKQRKVLYDAFINKSIAEIKIYSHTIHNLVKYLDLAEEFLADHQLAMLKEVIGYDNWQEFLAWECFWSQEPHA